MLHQLPQKRKLFFACPKVGSLASSYKHCPRLETPYLNEILQHKPQPKKRAEYTSNHRYPRLIQLQKTVLHH